MQDNQIEERSIEIIPFGSDEKIKLNIAIVQKMIAVPTKSGAVPNPTQCMKFMMLCKARHLNPFEGDAYLLGYDTQHGPQFSLITAHQVFLKRAEASEGFDGMESGVIVDADGIIEREGDLTMPGEKLIGGWAKVYRKDRSRPFYKRLKLETFSTGRSRWEKDPAGMIVKCAEADALRTAFPTHLGGLYMKEEPAEIDITPKDAKSQIQFGTAGLPAPEPSEIVGEVVDTEKPKRTRRTKAQIEADEAAAGNSAKESTPAPPRATPLEGLRNLINASPISEEELRTLCIKQMRMEPSETFDKLPDQKLLQIIEDFMTLANQIVDAREKPPF